VSILLCFEQELGNDAVDDLTICNGESS